MGRPFWLPDDTRPDHPYPTPALGNPSARHSSSNIDGGFQRILRGGQWVPPGIPLELTRWMIAIDSPDAPSNIG